MKGMYNGVTMKLRYLYPKQLNISVTNLSKKAEQRLRWIDWYYGHDKNARLTCRHFGISPSVFYRWLNRFEDSKKSLSSLEDKSKRPKQVRKPTTERSITDLIVKIREENPAWSKYKIQRILDRDYDVKTSDSTVGRVLKRRGLINNKQYGYRRKPSKKINHKISRTRATKSLRDAYPGSLIQVDTKRLNILGNTYYQFTAVDCCTRIQYIDVFSTITSSSGKKFLQNMLEYFPFDMDVQSDNGSEFLKDFHKLCDENNIKHYFIYPHCPKQNGRVERLNQTCEYEYWDYQEDLFPNIGLLKQKASYWNWKYNTYRPHQSLGYATPQEFYEEWLENTPESRRPDGFLLKLLNSNVY